jgi:hypothetical protein
LRRRKRPALPGRSEIFSLRVTPRFRRAPVLWERDLPRAPPVSRANLLVGKLGLLHQTPSPAQRNSPKTARFGAFSLHHRNKHQAALAGTPLGFRPRIAPAQVADEPLWCTLCALTPDRRRTEFF